MLALGVTISYNLICIKQTIRFCTNIGLKEAATIVFYFYLKRLLGEIPFSPKTTGLGLATVFTAFMLTVTSIAGAQQSDKPSSSLLSNIRTTPKPLIAKIDSNTISTSYLTKTEVAAVDTKIEDETVKYVVKKGDTVASIAKKFDITSDTVRWANYLDGNQVEEGSKLKILPVNGFEYKVREGDNARDLADKYEADAAEIITFNDIAFDGSNVNGMKTGETIIIPDGVNPPPNPIVLPYTRVTMSDPSGYNTVTRATTSTPTYSGNSYPWGNCTWYVSNRRAEIGRPIPNKLGNAGSWAYSASSRGIKVDHSPSIGAVIVEAGQGHVAIVERINPDGSITISEMNYNWRLGVKSNRTIPAGSVSRHSYIH